MRNILNLRTYWVFQLRIFTLKVRNLKSIPLISTYALIEEICVLEVLECVTSLNCALALISTISP